MANIIFCGGDKRELMVMNALLEQCYRVQAFAWPGELLPGRVSQVEDIQAALAQADACILPQPPLKKDGQLHSLCQHAVYLQEEDLQSLRPQTPVLCGVASRTLRYGAEHCHILELTDDDRQAIPMAAASAEGAIAEAMMISGNILCGAKALLLGFGRIGKELAWRLDGLGMEVTVMNRGASRSQEAQDLGYLVIGRAGLVEAALQADYIFNTVPEMILDNLIIGLLHRETNIIDLAAYPGGTDFSAAERRGIKAIHAGGMPGKYAATYSGQIMAELYPNIIESLLNGEADKYGK